MTGNLRKEALHHKKDRLQLYLEREKVMLSPNGIKSYGVGKQNIERYDTDLKDVQRLIKSLEREIHELEIMICGGHPRKSVSVVPHDW